VQRATRPHGRGRQRIHLDIAGIDDDDIGLRIEHAQALRHVVDRIDQPAVLPLQAAADDKGKGEPAHAKRGEHSRGGRGASCETK
jgi:hypothetical protein